MIYLDLFLSFLKIGTFSFGGGYGMLSLMSETVVNMDWLTEAEFLDFVAVAESTPGPIAVNMATFIGSSQAGILGSLIATIGVVLPAFIIMLLIVSLLRKVLQYKGVQNFLGGVRPGVVGLIIATALTMGLSVLFGISNLESGVNVNWYGIPLFILIFLVDYLVKKYKKKKLSPVVLILISAVIGAIVF